METVRKINYRYLVPVAYIVVTGFVLLSRTTQNWVLVGLTTILLLLLGIGTWKFEKQYVAERPRKIITFLLGTINYAAITVMFSILLWHFWSNRNQAVTMFVGFMVLVAAGSFKPRVKRQFNLQRHKEE